MNAVWSDPILHTADKTSGCKLGHNRYSLSEKRLPHGGTAYFSSSGTHLLNLRSVEGGQVQATIDCLPPLLMGEFELRDDKWITDLQVEKGVTRVPETGVKVLLWRARR